MTSDNKKILKEISIWGVLIGITFVGTQIYSYFKPESVLGREYAVTYSSIMSANSAVAEKNIDALPIIEEARADLFEFKDFLNGNEGYVSTLGNWSSILDNAQEGYVNFAKDSLKEAQVAKRDNTKDAQEKVDKAVIIIDNMLKSELVRPKKAAEILVKEVDKLVSN